ncbi:MAG: hypothetical protein DLM55_02120 [Acidimicrobiales bacterium]|nr:MAG: hypothetical protein DLM55_02120 [Acidimicrobiales bacterium]
MQFPPVFILSLETDAIGSLPVSLIVLKRESPIGARRSVDGYDRCGKPQKHKGTLAYYLLVLH